MLIDLVIEKYLKRLGGPGSGHFGHASKIGHHGGSAPSSTFGKRKVSERRPKADVVQKKVVVEERDSKGRPSVVVVPGSKDKKYTVSLDRSTKGIHTTCMISDWGTEKPKGSTYCQGNRVNKYGKSIICYHSIAAVNKSLNEAGYEGSWCSTEDDALKLGQLKSGGFNIMPVYSDKVSNDPGAFVVYEKKVEKLHEYFDSLVNYRRRD